MSLVYVCYYIYVFILVWVCLDIFYDVLLFFSWDVLSHSYVFAGSLFSLILYFHDYKFKTAAEQLQVQVTALRHKLWPQITKLFKNSSAHIQHITKTETCRRVRNKKRIAMIINQTERLKKNVQASNITNGFSGTTET